MKDWAQIAAGTTPEKSLAAVVDKLLHEASASSEAQLQARVEELMGSRFLGADKARAMLRTQDIGSIAPLPKDIVEVLNMKSPVHETGVLVKQSHLLAFIPENVSLKMLSEALGGQAGKKLFSDWFIKESNPIADLTLSSVGKKGHWALVPDRLSQGTESKGFDASVAELQRTYGKFYTQPDVISFATALLLNNFKNNERCYSSTYAWCRDPRVGTSQESDSCFGGGHSRAVLVGDFASFGLRVYRDDPGNVDSKLGCAACWSFGT